MKVSLSLLSFSPRMALRRIYCRSSAKRIPKRKRNSSKNSFLSWNVETRRSKDLLCWDTNKVRFIYVINYSESRFILFFAVDLHLFFEKVSQVGGYDGCMSKKAWKSIYDDLGGNPQNTSAATCTRRHYEK